MKKLTSEQTSLILDNISELVILHDEDIRISGINEAACKVIGRPYEEIIGKKCCDLLSYDENFCSICLAERVKETETFQESEVQTVDGRIYLARAYPLKDDKGRVTGCVNVLRDITVRKNEREALKYLVRGTSSVTGEEFLREMVQALAHWLNFKWILLSEIDNCGSKLTPLIFWNEGKFSQAPEYDLAGTPCLSVIKKQFLTVRENVQELYPEDADLVKMGAVSYTGFRLQDQHGDLLGVLCALNDKPFTPPSNLEEAFMIFAQRASAEILRLRMERELREARDRAELGEKAKTEFLATISHELLTPLNAVIGFSEILKRQERGSLNDKQARYVNNITFSGKRLHRLISDMLDLSRSEFGFLKLNRAHFNLRQVFDEVFSLLQYFSEEKKIYIRKNISSEPEEVYGDKDRFQRILSNLIGNAIKFTPVGGAITVISTLLGDESEVPVSDFSKASCPHLLVSVSDTGIGIDEEDQAGLFEIFHQLDSSYSREYPGAGVGLSLARKFVELHGGHIWVESSGKGRGATFSFVIPLVGTSEDYH